MAGGLMDEKFEYIKESGTDRVLQLRREAYKEAFESAKAGDASTCPHDVGSDIRASWILGFANGSDYRVIVEKEEG